MDDLSFRVREASCSPSRRERRGKIHDHPHSLRQLARDGGECASAARTRTKRRSSSAGASAWCSRAAGSALSCRRTAQPRGALRHPGHGIFPPSCGADGPAGLGERCAAPSASGGQRRRIDIARALLHRPRCSSWMSRRRALTRRRESAVAGRAGLRRRRI